MSTFEQVVLPHLDAAYNLADGWCETNRVRSNAAQEACLRLPVLRHVSRR